MNWGRRRVVNNGVAIQLLSLNAYVYSMGEFRIDPTLNIYAIIGAEPFCTFWQQSSTYSLIEKKLYSGHWTYRPSLQLSYLLYCKIFPIFWARCWRIKDIVKIIVELPIKLEHYLDQKVFILFRTHRIGQNVKCHRTTGEFSFILNL